MTLLDQIFVLECSPTLTAANVGLRMAQLGASVERLIDSRQGDPLRSESFCGEPTPYYAKSRGKSELALDSASAEGRAELLRALSRADVVIFDRNRNLLTNFGLDVEQLREEYPRLIIAEYSDYGSHTTYRDRLGDDLLVQAISGITWLTGNRDDAPTPMGFKVAAQFCATYLTQGIFAALYRREVDGGRGSRVSSSLLEAIILVQLEAITTSANSGMKMPTRTKRGNAHAGLPAPYGVYRSRDGFFAMSFVAITKLFEIMELELPEQWVEREAWLWYRDEIMAFLEPHFLGRTNREWLELFTPLDIWCSDINDLATTLDLEAYKNLDIEESWQVNGQSMSAIACPYTIETSPAKAIKRGPTGDAPYSGLLAIDISQYLSGPTSTLQLADFGATVVKIERPNGGDMGRNVIISNLLLDDTSSSFLAVGRNKRSAALDLKSDDDRAKVKELMRQADVIVQNFRPSVMERLGLDYETIKAINPEVIYAEISGYGTSGCWARKPGQDYIVQALSGLCMLSGQRDQEPVPIGLSVVDLIAGCHVDEAVTAAIYHRARSGEGAHIKVTMFGSAMDLQSDFITAHRWREGNGTQRALVANGDLGEDAPYGIYRTADGYVAIGSAVAAEEIVQPLNMDENLTWRECDDLVRAAVAEEVIKQTTDWWCERLGERCGRIESWQSLFQSPLGSSLDMLQSVTRGNGFSYTTTRCPVRFNDRVMKSSLGAPRVGEYTQHILNNITYKKTN